jgi:hypothetical protein
MIKDGRGRFYNPLAEFNNIPSYDTTSGYQIYVDDFSALIVRGAIIDPNSAIHLTSGWNMVAYYPREPIAADMALSGLGGALTIAKNISGRFYLPAYDFNSLGNLSEGFGYLIKVTEDADLIYQPAREGGRVAVAPKDPVHYVAPQTGGDNHSLLLLGESSMAGWEVGIVDAWGRTVGGGLFDPTGKAGVAVWGDNPETSDVEGLKTGQKICVRIWDGTSEFEYPLRVLEGKLEWTSDGLTVAKIEPAQIPIEFGLAGTYPNPFNSSTRISFGLPEASTVNLAIYDLAGRQVISLANSVYKAGRHAVVWRGAGTPSGIYIVRLEAGGRVSNRKVTLIR